MAILRTHGFVQLRRGLQEHITNGSMSVVQLGIYCLILMNADPATGIWRGSAGLISSVSGQSARTCRDAFERLEKAGYIKRFAVQGKHGSYPILVNHFECSDGAMRGMRLNALETISSDAPLYKSCHEDGDDDVNERVNDDVNDSAAKYLDNKRTDNKRKKTSRAKAASDPRHTPFRDALGIYWEHRNPSAMPWDGRDAKALGDMLGASPDLTLEQFRQFLQFRSKSVVAHGDRVYLWIAKIHSYTQPLNEYNRPEAINGKHSGLQSPAIERQHRNFDNLKQAMVDSGDYPPGYVNGQNSRLLPEPGAEHRDLQGIPGGAKRDRN